MKKTLLLIVAIIIGFFAFAQKSQIKGLKANFNPTIGIEPIKEKSLLTTTSVKEENVTPERDVDIVSIIDIGTSANAYSYGYRGGQKQILTYNPDLNILTHFHRMGGALDPDGYSGDLGYDISLDGGITWEKMVECYVATENAGGEYYTDAARYPNHGMWNSDDTFEGAYVVFFCPNLDGTNDIWGGYSYGIINIADTSIRTKNLDSSPDDVYTEVPDGYTFTSQGLSLCLDFNQDWTSGTLDYLDQMILNKGYYDDGAEDFVYEQELIDFEVINEDEQFMPTYVQAAFSADGMTGYIVTLADNGSNEHIGETYGFYPIYWKTTDGGENWEGPSHIQLDGPNGLGGIVYHLIDDETYVEFFEDTPREEVGYTTGFDLDCAVDNSGDLHIAVAVGATASSNYSISSNQNLFGIMDIYTTDGGVSWFAEIMGYPQCFRGGYPDPADYYEDNRVQITTNKNHDKLFISWLDTDIEDQEDNNRPNIYARGFDPITLMKTVDNQGTDGPTNVTFLSTGWRASHFAIAANYCIENDGVYTIPYTYQEMDVIDPIQPVQYKYITDFSFSDADFLVQNVSSQPEIAKFEVSQNYPNPVNGQTYFTVSLDEGSDLNLEVTSITGQLISNRDLGYKSAGTHTLTINANDLSAGVYFYSVSTETNKITLKMIVQ